LPNTRLDHVAHVDLLDLLRLDASLLHGMFDGRDTELRRGQRRERSVDGRDGRSGSPDDVDSLSGLSCQFYTSRLARACCSPCFCKLGGT
jgi:hypothetical protein